jgi:bifunctional DNA-binding transcriptional regulator/antitoxin component of YhaV-PrlF toxin-antitoxin module
VRKIARESDLRCYLTEFRTKLGQDGELVIPAECLQALGIEVGDTVILRLEDGEMHIFTPKHAIRKAQELVSHYLPNERSLSDELIAERRLED